MSQPLAAADLAAALLDGGLALFPTDTVPALAATPLRASLIWVAKDRPQDKPLILMGADLDQLITLLGVRWRESWLNQAARCWPGAVTLVLPIAGDVTEALHPGGHSLGLRVPACPQARELLRLTGPLATTSANRSGEPAALDADQASRIFPELPLLAPVPWPPGSGSPSIVLAWSPAEEEEPHWRVLRAGVTMPQQGGGTGCSA